MYIIIRCYIINNNTNKQWKHGEVEKGKQRGLKMEYENTPKLYSINICFHFVIEAVLTKKY